MENENLPQIDKLLSDTVHTLELDADGLYRHFMFNYNADLSRLYNPSGSKFVLLELEDKPFVRVQKGGQIHHYNTYDSFVREIEKAGRSAESLNALGGGDVIARRNNLLLGEFTFFGSSDTYGTYDQSVLSDLLENHLDDSIRFNLE